MSFDYPIRQAVRANTDTYLTVNNTSFASNNKPSVLYIAYSDDLTVILTADVASNGVVDSSQSTTFTNIPVGFHNIQVAKIITAPPATVALK